jgi:hypothetical protein
LNQEFARLLLLLIGIAAGVALVVYVLVYAGGSRRAKRYRPGRTFEFTPVWFLAAPERQSVAGSPGRELTAAPAGGVAVARPRETGGASDRW